jgi:hypothetical protein
MEIPAAFHLPLPLENLGLLRVTTVVPPFIATFVISSPYKPHDGRERV